MPRKIIFFHLLNNFTGSPLVLRNVIEIARNNGFDVELYTSNSDGFLSGIREIRYHTNFYKRFEVRILTLFSFFLSQFLLSFLILYRYLGSSTIFYVNTILPFGSILTGKILGKKVITHVHEYEISPRALSNFLFWIVRRFSSEVVLVSNFLKSNPKIHSTKSRVIFNCVTEDFENNVNKIPFKKPSFKVLMLASLRPYKGINEFIKLAEKIPESQFELVLSDEAAEVAKFEIQNQIPVNLRIFPVQKNVQPFYQSASLLVNLTQKDKVVESFGLTVLEGMYYGLPAIVPTVGGISELIDTGVNGFQIDYTRLDLIELEIRKMMGDKKFWEKLSLEASSKKEKFSRKGFKSQILQLLSE